VIKRTRIVEERLPMLTRIIGVLLTLSLITSHPYIPALQLSGAHRATRTFSWPNMGKKLDHQTPGAGSSISTVAYANFV
jgi:hypothetical protein